MPALTLQQAFGLAAQRHQTGHLQEAEAIYRQILQLVPDHADSLHLLGVLNYQTGQPAEAEELIGRAIAVNPVVPAYHTNLGLALKAQGKLEEAVSAYREALRLRPGYAEVHFKLGNLFQSQGKLDEAIDSYREAIRIRPDYVEAHSNLGSALQAHGQLEEAIRTYREALRLKPDCAAALDNLGNALKDLGRFEESIAAHREALRIEPNHAEMHNNLGNVLQIQGKLDEAIDAYHEALRIKPDCAQALNNLGSAFQAQGKLEKAVATYDQALRLRPDDAEAHKNRGVALQGQGRLDEAIEAYREALRVRPDYINAHSHLVYSLLFHPNVDPVTLAQEHREWNRRHAAPLGLDIQTHGNVRDPQRKLRIGYVSPDFCDHCQSFFTIPLFSNHDRRQFEIVCYSGVVAPDAITGRIRGLVDGWRSTIGMSDGQLAELIRADGIDILVDLTLHMAGHRLLTFARKPAPVQVTWLGYPGTTGLDTMDYRLSDPYLHAPDKELDGLYAEQTIRLPASFWCYDPLEAGQLPVSPLPGRDRGHITFGCLNSFSKINEPTLRLWARVLQATEGSRLLLLAPEGSARRWVLETLGREGVTGERVEFVPRRPRWQYLKLYDRIDIGLDTFPYNGHTTSLDCFWMGVPVVTIIGPTVVGRGGWSLLSNLGLRELAGNGPEQFVQIAVDLAHDVPRLAELRAELRERMQRSPLMDAPGFARAIEAAYRQVWQTWCAQPTGSIA